MTKEEKKDRIPVQELKIKTVPGTDDSDEGEVGYDPELLLSKRPSKLVPRFELEPRLDNQHITEDDIPFDERDEMYGRIVGADWCVSMLIQSPEGWLDPVTDDFWRTPCDPETLECYLSPDEMRAYYEGFRDPFVERYPNSDFDLHDMYMLAENLVVSRHALRTDDTLDAGVHESNERYITQLESVLGVIGQAVEGEMEETNGF